MYKQKKEIRKYRIVKRAFAISIFVIVGLLYPQAVEAAVFTDYIEVKVTYTRSNGETCTVDSDCTSGNCADGVCCDTACSGGCEACNLSGSEGTCTTRNAGDNSECGTCSQCDGVNTMCQNTSSGQEGKNCTAVCSECNGGGSCVNVSDNTQDTIGSNTCDGECNACQSGICSTADVDTDPGDYCSESWSCDGSCSRTGSNGLCNASGSCFVGISENCPSGTACSGGLCEATNTCNATYTYCPAPGDGNYNQGGTVYCQGLCDGDNVCDYAGNCENHYVVDNIDSSLEVVDESETDLSTQPQSGITNVHIKQSSDSRQIAEMEVDFSTDLDWSALSAGMGEDKSFMHYPGGYGSIPGAAGSGFVLYIPIPEGAGSNGVWICPGAANLGEVNKECSSGVVKTEQDSDTSKVEIEGSPYWKVEGLTGTGGMSLYSDFALKDTLTRLEVSQASDHTIEFGSVNGLTNSGDTIEIQFDPAGQGWDLSSIGVADIDLEDDGVDKTLAAAAGADTWGVSINTTTDTITFTAPTSGTDYIAANSILVVKIGTVADGGTNQIVNPSTAAEYEVSMTNTYSSGTGGTETGDVSIPIVDDDTVNVTGYIDTVMSFDIDTAVSDVQCDAAGGASACNSHGGASDAAGYVVDLGELTLSTVNKSGDSVTHADGLTGDINYIWFDLETNASSGAVVTVVSQYESLYKDSTNEIPSVATGSEQQILAASGLYGLNHRSGFTNTTSIGSMLIDTDCDASSGDDYYCDVADGGTPISIFDSNSLPIDDGRMQFSVGASPDSADGTGTYTDQLTFVASATF